MGRPRTYCKVDGCDRECEGRGYCSKHYQRVMRHGTPEDPRTPRQLCSYEGCDRMRHAFGYCEMHAQRIKVGGHPDFVTPKIGVRNPMWKAAGVSYSGAHVRVRSTYGPARHHTCACGDRADEWAYLGGDPGENSQPWGGSIACFGTNPEYYEAMCLPCHRRFDATNRKAGLQ